MPPAGFEPATHGLGMRSAHNLMRSVFDGCGDWPALMPFASFGRGGSRLDVLRTECGLTTTVEPAALVRDPRGHQPPPGVLRDGRLPHRPGIVSGSTGRRKGAARPCGMGLRPTLPPPGATGIGRVEGKPEEWSFPSCSRRAPTSLRGLSASPAWGTAELDADEGCLTQDQLRNSRISPGMRTS